MPRRRAVPSLLAAADNVLVPLPAMGPRAKGPPNTRNPPGARPAGGGVCPGRPHGGRPPAAAACSSPPPPALAQGATTRPAACGVQVPLRGRRGARHSSRTERCCGPCRARGAPSCEARRLPLSPPSLAGWSRLISFAFVGPSGTVWHTCSFTPSALTNTRKHVHTHTHAKAQTCLGRVGTAQRLAKSHCIQLAPRQVARARTCRHTTTTIETHACTLA